MFCRRKLAGCTIFITGATRGIGKAIALKAAKDGANIVIAAKTTHAHPKLPGTIYTAAEESKCDNAISWKFLSLVSLHRKFAGEFNDGYLKAPLKIILSG